MSATKSVRKQPLEFSLQAVSRPIMLKHELQRNQIITPKKPRPPAFLLASSQAVNLIAVQKIAVRAARAGGGPQLVVGDLLRLVGHGEHDDGSYVDPAFKTAHVGGDCVLLAEKFLIAQGWATESECAKWRREAEEEVNTTVDKVRREPSPTAEEDDWAAFSNPEFAEIYAGA